MKPGSIFSAITLAMLLCLGAAADEGQKPATTEEVHRLALPEVASTLPPGKGVEVVQLQCGVCHTTHYILNQPRLSRTAWSAEVTKMIKSFAAPVPPEQVQTITDYLVSVRGVETAPATRP